MLEECTKKSRNITLWIANEYFHDLERVCTNVGALSISRLPNEKEKKILFDKFEIEEAEMEKLKIPYYVATFCRHIEQKQH